MEFGRDRCASVFRNPICNASLAFADGQEARLVTSKDGRSVNIHLLIFIYKKRWVIKSTIFIEGNTLPLRVNSQLKAK